MLRTIIFDLGGVIVPLDFDRGYAAIQKRCNYDADEIQRRIRETGLLDELECGRVDPKEFARIVGASLGLTVSFEEFCDLWATIFPPHTLTPESLLTALASNYRLVLLSNTNAIHFPFILRNYPLLSRFDDLVLSYEEGVMKPDAAIFLAAAKRSGCEPQECFFTDDVEANVEGARRVGMDAVRFESADKLIGQLRSRGVEV